MISPPTLRQRLVSLVTRRYPFYSGCGTFANSKLVNVLAGQSSNCVWAHVPGGELLAPLNDYVGRAAYFVGDLDRKITGICSLIVKPGDTALDIGANIGLVTVHLSTLVGKQGRVHAFEPNPRMQEFVRKAMERNNLSNVSLHPFGLGDKMGVLNLTVPKDNAGAGSLIRNVDRPNCDIVEVPIRTLSDVVEKEGIKSIKLMKIDVEGFEAQVFQGGASVLEQLKPEAILFELNDHWKGPVAEQPCFRILKELGYQFFSIPKQFCSARIKPLDSSLVSQAEGHDFLASPAGPVYEKIHKMVN